MTKKKAPKKAKNRGAKQTLTTGKSVTPPVEKQLAEGQKRLDAKTKLLKGVPAVWAIIPMPDGWEAPFVNSVLTGKRFLTALAELMHIFRDDESAFLIAQMKCMEAHRMLIGICGEPMIDSAAGRAILQMKDVFEKVDEIREILKKQ